jgi:SAM-dependent methyltransferase
MSPAFDCIDVEALKRAQPDLIIEFFEGFDGWISWFERNRWVVDPGLISESVAYARDHGIGSPWLGSIPPEGITIRGEPPDEHVFVGWLSPLHRVLLDLIAAMPVAADHQRTTIYAAEAQSAFALQLRGKYPRFIGSEYYPEDPRSLFPIEHQDVTALSYQDAAFDIAVTIEVLEHVADLRAALNQLQRVLKPGGILLSTLPFLYMSRAGEVKAKLVADRIEHLVPTPEYHHDPHRANGALVFQLPGWDILDLARDCGFRGAGFLFYSSVRGAIYSPHLAGRFVLACLR